ncbi:uncharacterized protein LOC110311949 [Mus caroli]|uniref:Uncharacterized protein LOC110311949 n=1 Tax=Mus caroli TaxID=10089 RepID=A0A6P5RE55_MUSCR|nr:uncharacterized protein LOC110311949 [Mus caroli]
MTVSNVYTRSLGSMPYQHWFLGPVLASSLVWSLNVFCGVWISRELQRFTHQAFSHYEDTVHHVWKARQQEHEGAAHTASAVRKPRERAGNAGPQLPRSSFHLFSTRSQPMRCCHSCSGSWGHPHI